MMNTTTKPTPKHPEVEVQLTSEDGNAFLVLGRVAQALKHAGHEDEVRQFMEEATAGDYDDLLATVQKWVSVA